MKRKVHSVIGSGGACVTVYRDSETREFVCKLVGRPQADYFTDDKDDATTASAMLAAAEKKLASQSRTPAAR